MVLVLVLVPVTVLVLVLVLVTLLRPVLVPLKWGNGTKAESAPTT